jgi:CRP-like cAMP-binding protein
LTRQDQKRGQFGVGSPRRNLLLRALPADAFGLVAEKLVPVALRKGDTLDQCCVIFPRTGMVSMTSVMQDGRCIETALVGPEGFIELNASPERALIQHHRVQMAGTGWRLAVPEFKSIINRQPEALSVFLRYYEAVLAQTLQLVACAALHTAHERCCRRLLMTYDRVAGVTFESNQEELAALLGLRRRTVGETYKALQDRGVVRYSRGTISILHPARLQDEACECYSTIKTATGL